MAEGGGEGEADVEGSSEAVELNDDVEEAFERRWPCATKNVTSVRCVTRQTNEHETINRKRDGSRQELKTSVVELRSEC